MIKPRCTLYSTYCELHGFVHGGEAYALRQGLRQILDLYYERAIKKRTALVRFKELLEATESRDSLAYMNHEAAPSVDAPLASETREERDRVVLYLRSHVAELRDCVNQIPGATRLAREIEGLVDGLEAGDHVAPTSPSNKSDTSE